MEHIFRGSYIISNILCCLSQCIPVNNANYTWSVFCIVMFARSVDTGPSHIVHVEVLTNVVPASIV